MPIKPVKKVIGDYTFAIRPMGAFTAARLTGELAAVVVPLLSGILPLIGSKEEVTDEKVMECAPAIAGAFSSLSSERLEKLMKELLLQERCIGVEGPNISGAAMLTEQLSDVVFSGNVQNMFVLAYHVINVNFGDFFNSLGTRSGSAIERLRVPMLSNTEDLT